MAEENGAAPGPISSRDASPVPPVSPFLPQSPKHLKFASKHIGHVGAGEYSLVTQWCRGCLLEASCPTAQCTGIYSVYILWGQSECIFNWELLAVRLKVLCIGKQIEVFRHSALANRLRFMVLRCSVANCAQLCGSYSCRKGP